MQFVIGSRMNQMIHRTGSPGEAMTTEVVMNRSIHAQRMLR